jgi:hypothetical protein
LVIGIVEVAKGEGLENIVFQGCNLTTHISSHNKDKDILIMAQPFYVLVPTNILGDWYTDRGPQVVKELKGPLLREKRMEGLCIAGILVFVTMMAMDASATAALTQGCTKGPLY